MKNVLKTSVVSITTARLADAARVFELNVRLFPQSANVYDSLGEAYLNPGDKERALANYGKSLTLNPKNHGAGEAIDRFTKENQKKLP